MFRRLLLAAVLAAGATTAAQAQQCDTRFDLINRSGAQVNEFYFGSSSNRNWGPDRLGDGVLSSGQSRRFQPRTTGMMDFKVVWENGESAEVRQVDICSASEVVATRSGITVR